MFLVALVCLFVCLFDFLLMSNITQEVMNGLQLHFMKRSRVVQKKIYEIMVVIWVFLEEQMSINNSIPVVACPDQGKDTDK